MYENRFKFLQCGFLLALTSCSTSPGTSSSTPTVQSTLVGSWHNLRLKGNQFDSALIHFTGDGNFTETAVFSQVGSYWQTVKSIGTWTATRDSLTMVTWVSNESRDTGRTWKPIMDSAYSYTTAYSLASDSLYWVSWDTANSSVVRFGLKRL